MKVIKCRVAFHHSEDHHIIFSLVLSIKKRKNCGACQAERGNDAWRRQTAGSFAELGRGRRGGLGRIVPLMAGWQPRGKTRRPLRRTGYNIISNVPAVMSSTPITTFAESGSPRNIAANKIVSTKLDLSMAETRDTSPIWIAL